MNMQQLQGSVLLAALLLLLLGISSGQADLLDCDTKMPESITDLTDKLSELGHSDSAEHEVRDFFKSVGCQIKESAKKLSEKAKTLGTNIKESAKQLSDRAKEVGTDLKERFEDFRVKLAKDSVEEMSKDRGFLANVEIINPDILKSEQQCGHGHILDALGNCSKLRK